MTGPGDGGPAVFGLAGLDRLGPCSLTTVTASSGQPCGTTRSCWTNWTRRPGCPPALGWTPGRAITGCGAARTTPCSPIPPDPDRGSSSSIPRAGNCGRPARTVSSARHYPSRLATRFWACEAATWPRAGSSAGCSGGGPQRDGSFERIRQGLFIVAVNCTEPGGCFCPSMGTGPAAGPGYDLALTERIDGVSTGSPPPNWTPTVPQPALTASGSRTQSSSAGP